MSNNEQISIRGLVRDDLEKTAGKRTFLKANLFEKKIPKKVSPELLHVNPDDEFSFPDIGPNNSIIENYARIARRNESLGKDVYPEPITVCKLKGSGYMMLNGHHRWAGALIACVKTVRIIISDP